MRLILASASPARRELLARLGHPFEVVPADIDEPESGFSDPRTFVQTVSWLKAAAVAPRIEEGIILAADTIAWINNHPVLKPADEADARHILREMAGREHDLWSGVVLWRRPDDLQIVYQEQTRVAVAPLSDAELDVYLATRSWRGHSGSYAIQEKDDPYVRVVRGSVTNVIGLPLESLAQHLPLLCLSTAAFPSR
ncbi:MAG TPA: Maf family protein [Gemmataceae bacterium]|nr:Maf family protein [Gemmataceae bacterium]